MKIEQPTPAELSSAVLRVGKGRGFVVERRFERSMHRDRIVITAAHCLPFLPAPDPAAHFRKRTYQTWLGPLGAKPTVWAELVFADPIADIAVLGAPDDQELSEEVDAYKDLVASAKVHPLAIAEAPAQRDHNPAECEVRVLLKRRWRKGCVERRGGWLEFPKVFEIEGGMSGSPIIDMSGKAIGVASVTYGGPVLVDSLSTRLLRSIKHAP